MNKIYVLYHADCTDGLGSRFAAWKKFGDAATYLPVQYGKAMPEIEDNSEVYIVDFSYPRNELEALHKRVSKLQVLDHHKTAEEALKGLDFAFFNMKKSGAVLSWEYFHPDTPVPELLLHIEDRDLWNWKKPGTREVLNALSAIRQDFEKWDALNETPLNTDFKDKWKLISDYEDDYVISACGKAKFTTFYFGPAQTSYNVALYNSTLLGSEIGSRLCRIHPIDFSIGYFVNKDGKLALSFRSAVGFDTTPIAKHLGGGGHMNASGAIVDLSYLTYLYE